MRYGNRTKNNADKLENKCPKIDGISLNILLRQTVESLYKIRENELQHLGITPEQASALITIKSIGDKATIAELARWLFRKRNTTSVTVKRLEKLGLVKKTPIYIKNSIRLNLTSRGNEVCDLVAEFTSIRDIINALPHQEQEVLWKILHRLRDSAITELGMDVKYYSPLFDNTIVSAVHSFEQLP